MTSESVAINIGGDETAGIAARIFARGKVTLRLERTRAERATATLARRRVSAGN
jgi:hypothetical protein